MTKFDLDILNFLKHDSLSRFILIFQGLDISGGSDQPIDNPESVDEIDVMELQSELLVCLCPKITQEPDILRQILHREATGRNLPREEA